jgi:hypothetical protein
MKKPVLSFILNFFTMGLGYVYNCRRKTVGVLLFFGAALATYVELKLRGAAPQLYPCQFMAFVLMGAALGGDAYKEAKSLNGR